MTPSVRVCARRANLSKLTDGMKPKSSKSAATIIYLKNKIIFLDNGQSADALQHPPPPSDSYLEEPVAGLSNEGEAHGAFGHGQLAVFVSSGGPAELPQLLGHHQQQRHGHQAGGQGGQSGHQVEAVEQHDGAEESGDGCAQKFFVLVFWRGADVRSVSDALRARSGDALKNE